MGRIIAVNNPIILPKCGLAGFYRVRKRKAKSGALVQDTGWFHNIVTDVGLVDWYNNTGVGGSSAYGSMCAGGCVGTGSAPATVHDTQLANFTASNGPKTAGDGSVYVGFDTTGYVAAAAPAPAYWFGRTSWQYGTGVAAGNLTEVGVFPGGVGGATGPLYNGHLFSRALIVDTNGAPTAITVLSDEILTVTWELRFYLDLTDHAFTFNLNGAPITGTYRMYSASSQRASYTSGPTRDPSYIFNAYNGDIVSALSGAPNTSLGAVNNNGAGMTVSNFMNDLQNSGTCYKDMQFTVPINYCNGTINSFVFQSHMWTYQFGALSQPIIKLSGQQLQCNFRTVWGRYTP